MERTSGKRIHHPCGETYGKLIALLDKMDQPMLKQVSKAGIKFVSKLTLNRVIPEGEAA